MSEDLGLSSPAFLERTKTEGICFFRLNARFRLKGTPNEDELTQIFLSFVFDESGSYRLDIDHHQHHANGADYSNNYDLINNRNPKIFYPFKFTINPAHYNIGSIDTIQPQIHLFFTAFEQGYSLDYPLSIGLYKSYNPAKRSSPPGISKGNIPEVDMRADLTYLSSEFADLLEKAQLEKILERYNGKRYETW